MRYCVFLLEGLHLDFVRFNGGMVAAVHLQHDDFGSGAAIFLRTVQTGLGFRVAPSI